MPSCNEKGKEGQHYGSRLSTIQRRISIAQSQRRVASQPRSEHHLRCDCGPLIMRRRNKYCLGEAQVSGPLVTGMRYLETPKTRSWGSEWIRD